MSGKIGLVIGGNRGIGFALVQALAKHWGESGTVYLTVRRPRDGDEAVACLAADGWTVKWLPFDLADPASPATLAASLREQHGTIDIAVLNGAYVARANVPAADDARPMIEANNHGSLRFLRAMAPAMGSDGRLIVVASGLGTLRNLPKSLRVRFDTKAYDSAAIDRAMDDYVAAVEARTAASEGWPDWVNIPSKVGQVAATRAFAKEQARGKKLAAGVLINSACPGLTVTEATRDFLDTVFKGRPAQTPEQAAVDLLWLATLPPGTTAPYGELVQHRKVLPFGD